MGMFIAPPYKGQSFTVEAKELQPSSLRFAAIVRFRVSGDIASLGVVADVGELGVFDSETEAFAIGKKAAYEYIDRLPGNQPGLN
jgi:hypothetical protein